MKEKLNEAIGRDITLKQLGVACAVAQYGKITSAANALGVTPPAVTLQLKLLEQKIGMPLFERAPGGLRPTDAGRIVLAAQARIAGTLSECRTALSDLKGLRSGRLRLGAVSTAKYFVPLIIAAFAREYRGLRVEMLVGNRVEVIAALRDFRIDFAIMGNPPDDIETEPQLIGAHPHVMIAAPTHPLAARRRINLAALADDTILLREPGSGTRTLMERTFLAAQFEPKSGMEFESNETIKQAAMAGLGVAFISAHTVSMEVQTGRIKILAVENFPIIRNWYVVRPRERGLLPAANTMWSFLVSRGKEFLPDVSQIMPRVRDTRQRRTRSAPAREEIGEMSDQGKGKK